MKQNYESGRSMVEMLGTLAIVGVLSVGGIAGYSYGMDKYRANTIINDIMLRAIDVNAQFDSTGDANLSEWPTTTVGKYAIGLENETIGIQVSDLPKRLCEMVFEGMINNATVKIGTTEYDSATDDDICGDTNTMVFYVDDTASTKTEETTTTTEPPCKSDNCPCTSNDECNANQYCATTAPSCTEAFPSGTSGICKSLDFDEYTITIDGVIETWYLSHNGISYWEAQLACQRFGRMVKYSDLIDAEMNNDVFGPATERSNLLFDAIGVGVPTSIYVQDIYHGCFGVNSPDDMCCGTTVNMEISGNWFISGGDNTNSLYRNYKTLCKKI
ncbi:MAG: hypothetical protein IJV75_00740 [Alphaproteobacteria bacterium]|nr:hypothetical protein [Alphaproteobacteria bacterium]